MTMSINFEAIYIVLSYTGTKIIYRIHRIRYFEWIFHSMDNSGKKCKEKKCLHLCSKVVIQVCLLLIAFFSCTCLRWDETTTNYIQLIYHNIWIYSSVKGGILKQWVLRKSGWKNIHPCIWWRDTKQWLDLHSKSQKTPSIHYTVDVLKRIA